MFRLFLSSRSQIFVCLSALLFVIVVFSSAFAQTQDNQLVLKIDPTDEFPRNSEGSFVTLKDGTILYSYTQFYGGAGDHSKARIVSIKSEDEGKTWSSAPKTLVLKSLSFYQCAWFIQGVKASRFPLIEKGCITIPRVTFSGSIMGN